MTISTFKRTDLVYPELSFIIVGCAYEVFNELGPGHTEKIYQRALAAVFEEKKIIFKEQEYHPLKFKDKVIGRGFLDFSVDNKIIVELKKDQTFTKTHIDQVVNYLKLSNYKLAILINFTPQGVKFKRLVNMNQEG
jgi:GxxExxY protein